MVTVFNLLCSLNLNIKWTSLIVYLHSYVHSYIPKSQLFSFHFFLGVNSKDPGLLFIEVGKLHGFFKIECCSNENRP